jgi:hypothetical protein
MPAPHWHPALSKSCKSGFRTPSRALCNRDTSDLSNQSPTGLSTAVLNCLMRAGFLPLLKVRLGVVVLLLFFRIALPGLVRLSERTPSRPLPWIRFRRFFAHRNFSMETKAPPPKKGSSPSERIAQIRLESRFCGVGVCMMRRPGWTPRSFPTAMIKTSTSHRRRRLRSKRPGLPGKPTSSGPISRR